MTTIQFLKTDEDISNRIQFLTDEKFMLYDKGEGVYAIFDLPTTLTREDIMKVSKKDADTKIKKSNTLEDIIKRLEALELKNKGL